MLKIEEARGYESWTPMGGEERFMPLFKENEIAKVNAIIGVMDGMDLERAFELLEKIKKYLLQAAQITSS